MIDLDAAVSEKADWLEELKRSPGYFLVRDRIRAELERMRDDLEQPATQDATNIKRGWIGALRMVLNLPDILEDELKKEMSNVHT